MKAILLKEFEDKWGDDLKYVLHEQDVRELFDDISKLMDGVSVKVARKWELNLKKYKRPDIKIPEEKITIDTMIEL